jgi:alpha-L-fucosidase 2
MNVRHVSVGSGAMRHARHRPRLSRTLTSTALKALSAALLLTTSSLFAAQPQSSTQLWYDKPAAKWTDALPVGNGTLGGMVFGNPSEEHIQFNESTLWTGIPRDYSNPNALAALPKIRELLFQGDEKAAVELARAQFLSIPLRQKAFQPCGDLYLQFPGHDNVSNYRRDLDVSRAVARTSYIVNGTTFIRDVFASHPDNVIVVRLSADKPGALTFKSALSSAHKQSESKADGTTIILHGKVKDPKALPGDEDKGLTFEARALVQNEGGTVKTEGTTLAVTGADAVTILISAATSFKNFQDISDNPTEKVAARLVGPAAKNYAALLAGHLKDFEPLFNRVSLDLGATDSTLAAKPTDTRLKAMQSDNGGALKSDPDLAELHFNYGRYLLISSSRKGGEPANLQGIWNDLLDPPWESKFTTNINFEMNYWPAEVTNLPECHEPLFSLVDDLRISGARTAKNHYGCRGWVLNHNTDLWRGTAPINNIDGVWPTGGAWLCYHLWEHYLYTEDKAFLRDRGYPAMKEASLFFFDFLTKDPKTGYLISTPTHSPEQGGSVAGAAMDHQLIRELFDITAQSAKILGIEDDFTRELATIRPKVAPDFIGTQGNLMEWMVERPNLENPRTNHRHMSPLWCIFPGAMYTPNDADPKFFNAARLLLEWRGEGSTGWSYAWRVPLWARVHDGDTAYTQYSHMLAKRTLPNLFDLCGPFQIDGNFGATAGIAEMLLQSHMTAKAGGQGDLRQVDLLPALPKVWPSGSVTGLKARGGFTLDFAWRNGQLTSATVHSDLGNPLRLTTQGKSVDLRTEKGKTYTLNERLEPSN